MEYLNSDNNFYFEDNLTDGYFTIYEQDIEKTNMFVNFLFRKGPFGEFYAESKLQNITGENGNFIPYTSTIVGKFNYAYDWNFGIGFKIGLEYYNKVLFRL